MPSRRRRLTEDEVIAFCKEQLANFKVPRDRCASSTHLPRNPSGKVLKSVLREEQK